MIIKTSRLKEFLTLYREQIGTDIEWEEWSDTDKTTHIFGADIETDKEVDLYNELHKKFDVSKLF